MKYKNYYKILGLSGPRATEEEVKSAYRKLAKKYHPDRNPGNLEAAEKFKDINEAYQVLMDESAKRKYNRIHFAYSLKDGISVKNMKDWIAQNGPSDFMEMFLGKQDFPKKKKAVNTTLSGENIETEINLSLEEAFQGVQKKIRFKTENDTMKTIEIKVPSGIVNGGKIRLKGQGKPGKNGGCAGDLLIKVNLIENSKFCLQNANLIVEVPLTPSEATLGCKVEVEGLDSKTLLEIPAGTSSGEEFNIKSKGYFDYQGNRGDLIAKTKVVVPKEISMEERKLYEELQKIANVVSRKD